ncbi:hypothetical protein DDB_G0272182 [Dictyostelium discoideum AX4]|uniref:Arginine deiminase n=1 Tax=Dictyostelium discoideum TaxID=44689 RepID=Q75JW5_DICDI|nr:hypothetical protein DDB_G0272182 [Dictyostelium discoideum AX4]EAL71243.1 hypothetical protein DDB_G0272182 [Dictyostelium discoideum AX4]|eukprot:XP_645224.1 hypothetical protein DDB_G0272182 [Dictyostelium discoideum AX4]
MKQSISNYQLANMASPFPTKGPLYNLSGKYKDLSFNQVHENDEARIVILNEPSLPQWMGSIHPNGSLYEEPLDLSKAKEEHKLFRELLEKEGCTVFTVREILTGSYDQTKSEDIQHRVKLEDFAFNSMHYELDSQQNVQELSTEDKLLISDQYKKKCIECMSNEQLVEVILTRPTIRLRKSERDTELLSTEYSFKPLVNLIFQRDQQITTAAGIVLASLSSPIRAPEVQVMKLCFEILGLPIVGEIPEPGKLEGGDFYPVGRDLSLIGVGLRSNFYSVQYMMENDLFGTTRVAVVKDYFDQNQQRMHLDTVCNIIDERVMLILEDICGEDSPIRRLVDEYTRDDEGNYHLTRNDVEYSQYLKEEGFDLIYASNQNQKDYGCNGLNIGNGKFIVVDRATAKTIARSTKTNSQLLFVDFRTVTKMYGSVHCCSQVVSRFDRPRPGGSLQHSPSSDKLSPQIIRRNSRDSSSGSGSDQDEDGSDKFLMISPTDFVKDRIGMNASLIRQQRQLILQDYSKLHKLLVDAGVRVHLFCHEPYHRTDKAVFVADWFSTHDRDEIKSTEKNTLVLYPLSNQSRRRERRADILKFGFLPKYTRVLDFTPCEQGKLEYNETTIEQFIKDSSSLDESSSPSINGDDGYFIDFSEIVLDREHRLAYCSTKNDRQSKFIDLWASALGYKVIKINSKEAANKFIFIGSKFALFCPNALSSKEQSEEVIQALQTTSAKKVIEITEEQMNNSCAKIIQVKGNQKTHLLMSDKVMNSFTSNQLTELKSYVDQLLHADMSNLENMGAHNDGMISMLGRLV